MDKCKQENKKTEKKNREKLTWTLPAEGAQQGSPAAAQNRPT
jgi:hypothetical protein